MNAKRILLYSAPVVIAAVFSTATVRHEAARESQASVAPTRTAETGATTIGSLRRELLSLLQGGPVSVSASPALCAARGRLPQGFGRGTPEWYFSAGACNLDYPPDLEALVTPATAGITQRLAENEAVRVRAVSILKELQDLAGSKSLSAQDRLLLHSTAWELAAGLRVLLQHHPDRQPVVGPIACEGFRLLQATRFSRDEVAHLPDNLSEIPRLSGEPRISDAVSAILSRDRIVVEISPLSELHAEQLLGRFTARVFFTLTGDEEEKARFRTFVSQGPFRSDVLSDLHFKFPGVRAILILYFNVLTDAYEILPTGFVAFYQEYTFKDRLVEGLSFGDVAKLVDFLVIEYDASGTYRLVPQDSMTLQGFLNVKPTQPGREVTTLHAQCLKCHNYRIATFNTHLPRQVKLELPFERRGDMHLSEMYQTFETRLRAWAGECKAGSS